MVKTKKVVAAPPVVKKTPNKYRSAKFASYKTPLWAWKFTVERFIFRSRLITPLWVNFKVLTSRLISLFKTTWNQISILCNFFKRQIHHSLKHRTAWNSEIWKKNCKQIKKNISRFFFVNAEHYPGFLNPNNHNTNLPGTGNKDERLWSDNQTKRENIYLHLISLEFWLKLWQKSQV